VALGRLALLARLVSAVMGTAAAVFAGLTTAELFGRRAGILAAIVFLSSPVTVFYAHTTNVDIPYLCWAMGALWLAVRVARGDSAIRTFVLLGAAAALAIATKDQAYACFALLPLPLLWRRWQGGRLLDAKPLAALATFIVPILYVVPRYVLPMLAAMAPFAGLGLAALWGDAESPRASARRALVCLVVAAGIARGASMDVRLLTDARYLAESWIAANAASGLVGTDVEPSYLPRLAPTRPVVRIKLEADGLHYPGPDAPDLIVLSSARYAEYFTSSPRPDRALVGALLRGEFCYERAADFRSPTVFGSRLV